MAKTTIPVNKNINKEQGAIVLSIADIKKEENMHLITLGQVNITISFSETEEKISINEKEKELTSVEIHNDNLDIVISWEKNEVWLHVFTQDTIPKHIGSTSTVEVNNIFNSKISLFEGNYFNGAYQSLCSFSNSMDKENLSAFSLEAFKESTEILFQADFTIPTHYQKNVVIEDTFAPRDGSPILLSDDKGSLQRQYFFNETTGKYQNEIVERFLFKGEKRRSLAYNNIESTYKVKVQFHNPDKDYYFTGDGKVSIEGQELIFNLTNEDIEVSYGFEYEVTYQLERSYNVEFNEDVPHDGFRVNLVNMKAEEDGAGHYSSTKNIKMLREGNRFEQEYLAKEIELNPLMNPQVQGFMYIDKSPQETNAFRISASSQYVIGDGTDSASIMIEAIDSEGNEVLSPYLSVYLMNDKGDIASGFGSIEPVIGYNSMKARNTSGRAYYQLRAPILLDDTKTTHKVFIVALDRENGISAQYPIYIRTVNREQVFDTTLEDKSYLNIPFEYFARYFDRELEKDNPVIAFDYNKNGRLDRDDLEEFIRHFQKNSANAIRAELLKRENSTREIILSENTKWENILDFTWEEVQDKKIRKE